MRVVAVMVQFVVFLFASSAWAQVESIVRVRAHDGNRLAAEGSGFVVDEAGYVLTNAHLLADAERFTVVSLKTGAEIVARQVVAKREMNLALLRVQGLGLPALNLSEQGAAVGRAVRTLRFGRGDSVRISQGTIGTHYDLPGEKAGDPVVHLLHHNAGVTSKAFGMPVFNECGDVVGINTPDLERGRWPFRKNAEPRGTVFALRSNDIIAALTGRGIAYTVVEEACLSAVERAEQARKAATDSVKVAQARADSVKQAMADSIKAAEKRVRAERAARLAAERAKARADSVKRAVADSLKAEHARADSVNRALADSIKAAAADSVKTARERAKAKADSLAVIEERTAQQLQWIIIGGAALLLIALLGWALSSRRKKARLQSAESRLSEAEQEAIVARRAATAAPQPASFGCVLEGQDHAGRPFALRLSALALGDPTGAILGRSPDKADFVIDHESISRAHVRLSVSGGDLYAEDLNTLNGTRINGHVLNPGEPMVLRSNDQIELGPVVFQVRLVEA